jgi:ABC-2 type transport system ATP-binding protein
MKILHREALGGVASVIVDERLSPEQRALAARIGLEVAPVSLQQLVIRKTLGNQPARHLPGGDAQLDAMEATR